MTPSPTSSIAPGNIVIINGLDVCPRMFVSECDRTNAECFWFNRNSDLARARFPITALRKFKVDGKDSGEIPIISE